MIKLSYFNTLKIANVTAVLLATVISLIIPMAFAENPQQVEKGDFKFFIGNCYSNIPKTDIFEVLPRGGGWFVGMTNQEVEKSLQKGKEHCRTLLPLGQLGVFAATSPTKDGRSLPAKATEKELSKLNVFYKVYNFPNKN
jgi:hypothetical protein